MLDFIKSEIHLIVESCPCLALSHIQVEDLEHLRQWKNDHREFFFYQEQISVDEQNRWYESFMNRPGDLMFTVEYDGEAIGCMGIRWEVNHWDVYNLILGKRIFGKKGLMSKSFLRMLLYAHSIKPASITLKVLKSNPAITWYERQGFQITDEHEDFHSMKYVNKFSSPRRQKL